MSFSLEFCHKTAILNGTVFRDEVQMLQDLALMIGAYIVVRMLQALIKRESSAYIVVQIAAVLCLLFTLFIMAMTLTWTLELDKLGLA
jgi:hypothetical protein